MPIVTLPRPDVKQKTISRPQQCPYCAGENFQRWGKVHKPVRDKRFRRVQVYRYLCCSCRRTFRHYPQGVDRADQTQRMRKLATLDWVLGMSLRGVTIALSGIDVTLSHMTVWRDLQEEASFLEQRNRWQQVRVLGVDGMYPLVKRLEVSVIVTDDLASYLVVAEKLEVEHQVPKVRGQICQFHVRRWVGRTLYELRETVPKDWFWVLNEVKGLLDKLPLEGSRRLFDI